MRWVQRDMAEKEQTNAVPNPNVPPFLYLLSAFLSMEPIHFLMHLSKSETPHCFTSYPGFRDFARLTLLLHIRECGGGSITLQVQEFISKYCISSSAGKLHVPYLRSFVKKLICEAEANREEVLETLYEQYTDYIVMVKDDGLVKGESMARKWISFVYPNDLLELSSCPRLGKLVIPLQCSLNMLQGDTGCSVWPSSLLLSEFILSRPDIFANKSCFEVGSGVGLVGICLHHVKACKVILSDGDLSTLSNMKINLDLNHIESNTELEGGMFRDPFVVSCIHLPWESAAEKTHQLQNLNLDIILAADVIYDPCCLPHLVCLLSILLNQKQLSSPQRETAVTNGLTSTEDSLFRSTKSPVAYIASVIRNEETFNYFQELAAQASLCVVDMTEQLRPPNLLPYMHSYEKSKIHLFLVSNSPSIQ